MPTSGPNCFHWGPHWFVVCCQSHQNSCPPQPDEDPDNRQCDEKGRQPAPRRRVLARKRDHEKHDAYGEWRDDVDGTQAADGNCLLKKPNKCHAFRG
jgi:hypothetical protein